MNKIQGHLLTAHWSDDINGLRLTFYGTTGKNAFKLIFTNQNLIFFIESLSSFTPPIKEYKRKETQLKTFAHKQVDTIYIQNNKDLRIVKEYCQDKGIRTFELDILPTERFLMERFINSQLEFVGEVKKSQNLLIYENPQIRPTNFDLNFSSLSIDIETGIKGELYSIGLYYKQDGHIKQCVLMLSEEDKVYNESLIFYKNERSLLVSCMEIIAEWDPDFIIGWHVIGFDFKFLEKKCVQYGLALEIGREKSLLKIDDKSGMGFFAETAGRIIIDGPPTLRAAYHKFPNFRLETVAREVLGSGKDIASDENKVEEIERRFKEDKVALAKYNLLDCKLVTDIYEKLDIFNLLIERSKISGLLFDRLAISTAAFDHAFLPRLHRKGFVAPNRIDISRDDAASGGLVLAPKEGLHHNIAVFDFKSLYPTIIQTFNIDPYAKICENINPLTTPSGYKFSKTEHILPEIIESLLQARQNAKIHNKISLAQAVKILMNSFYGVMGSSRSRFYQAELPMAITTTGHWILNQSISFFSSLGFETIYGDTDSLFIQINENSVNTAVELASKLNIHLHDLIKKEFGLESKLECQFEAIFQKMFFAKTRSGDGSAKKRYVALKPDKTLLFKGMEFVRSDWTDLAKNFQKELFTRFLNNLPIEDFIKEYIACLESGIFDDQLVYTKKLSKAAEEYTKNIPVHVKAALKINHTGPYRLKEVSYVMTMQGAEPIQNNPRRFDYQHYIEKQLKPIADDILVSLHKNFDSFILGDQLAFDI